MSIFDQILILIDDQTELSLATIESYLPNYTRQAIASTLGRLASRNWLIKTESDPELYRITEAGNKYIGDVLDTIRKHEDGWNGQWFCVIVTLPESRRKERDVLRHYLLDRGFGRLADGFYVSSWNRQPEIAEIIRRLNIGASILMFETQPLGKATNQMIIQQAWDWDGLIRELSRFLATANDRVVKIEALAKKREPSDYSRLRFLAKSFVFEYGSILSGDANIPTSLTIKPELYEQALALYERVRPYCYR